MNLRGVIIVAIDCLRADHVSCYGYRRPTTPTIDALAGRGILWEQAYSVSSWTKPAVTSLLTGRYPCQHGAYEGIKRSKGRLSATTDRLRPTCPTVAETLAAHGWRCGAFMNNAQLGEFSGLDRGFQLYAPGAGKADRLIGAFRGWLEEDIETPFFAYLHFLEAHWPYRPRRRHMTLFGGDRDTNPFSAYSARDFGRLRRAVSRGETTLSAEQLGQMVLLYDAAVRRLDGRLKVILAALEELGLLDGVALFLTADHGEEFMDHGGIGHGQSLYDELTHVPLVVRVPGAPEGARRSEPVSLTGVAGMILSMAGIGAAEPKAGVLAGTELDEPVYGELRIRNRYTQVVRTRRWKLHRRFVFHSSNGQSTGRCLLPELAEACSHDVSYELYDVADDPGERTNLADAPACREVRLRLADRLERWWRQSAVRPDAEGLGEVAIDERVVRRLHELGYIE